MTDNLGRIARGAKRLGALLHLASPPK